MSSVRTIIAAATLAVAATAGGAGADAKPLIKPAQPIHLCFAHYESEFIEGVGKAIYFIDSRCQKHFVRFVIS